MYNLITKKTKAILEVLLLVFFLPLTTISQTISIDSTITSYTEIYPFNQVDSIYGISMTGHITLNSDTSLVRVILVDENNNKYMVYEAYPLITTKMDFDIEDVCDETCYLNGITPSSLIIYINHATITLQSLAYSTLFINNAELLSYQVKRQNDTIKVQNTNTNVLNRGWNWIAGHTPLVQMTYEKKQIYMAITIIFKGLNIIYPESIEIYLNTKFYETVQH